MLQDHHDKMFLWLKWIVLTMVINQIDCGLLDLFEVNSDNNLAQTMDAISASGNATTSTEEDVTFWCSNGNSTVLRQVTFNDRHFYQKIDPTKEVSFVIHGWLDDVSPNWYKQLVHDVLKYCGGNVCVVDWGRLARVSYYRVAVNHTMIASEYLTKFIQVLQSSGVPLERITMIGHSMGAQISGQVGYNLGGKIGQIYGLDPAGPYFTLPEDRRLQFRLDRSDAIYVQTIITSRDTIGVGIGEGHENFYPNGGASPQPNCDIPSTSDVEVVYQIVCSHLHAATLFRLSLNPSIVYQAKKCSDWLSFVQGSCDSNKVNVLGVHSDKYGGDYFLRTSAFSPYTV